MDFESLVAQANSSVEKQNIPEAINLFEQALKVNSTSYDVLSKLGTLNLQIGNLQASKEYFKKSLLINPNSFKAYSNLGTIYFRLNERELALKNYLKAIDINPKNFSVNYNLGNFFFFQNDINEAEKYFLISIDIQPRNFYPYNNLFQIYERSNNLEKLENIFHQIIKNFNRSPEVQFLEGIFEFRKKNYKKTIQIFKDLNIEKKLVQHNVLKENILAKCYDLTGRYNQAFEHFSLSNDILKVSFKNKFNKDRYLAITKKRLNYISNLNCKLDNSKENIDNFVDPIFLIGFPRSGTTLLDTILRTHKSIVVLEEKSLTDELIKNLENLINRDLSKLISINFEQTKHLRKLYFQKREALVGFDKEISYIDKLPLNIIHVAELSKIFPKSKFILALRNPYDVVLSCFMQPFIPNDAMSNFYNLNDTAELYNLVMTLWEKYEKFLDIDKYNIKYEDVVTNFDQSLKSLLKFLSIPWSDELKDFHLTAQKRGMINTPSYNQVNTPIYSKSISRWKNYSNKFSKFNFLLEKWSKNFGY